MTNLQLLPIKSLPQGGSTAEIVTLDRTEDEGITLRFFRTQQGNGPTEITLREDVAEQLLTMLTRELDGDTVMG